MPEISVCGHRFSWRETGEGPAVLLLHCSLAHSGLWKPVMAELAGQFRLIAPDLPAHGASDPPPDGVFLQHHAVACCEALLDRIGAPAHLVGISIGGAMIARLALRRPEAALSTTLIEPVCLHLLKEADHTGAEAAEAEHEQLAALCRSGAFREAARFFMDQWGTPGQFDALREVDRDRVMRSLSYLHLDFPLVIGFPPGQFGLADIARLPEPLLLINGSETRPSIRAVMEVLHQAHPRAERREITGAGHLSPVSHPGAVAGLLKSFMLERIA